MGESCGCESCRCGCQHGRSSEKKNEFLVDRIFNELDRMEESGFKHASKWTDRRAINIYVFILFLIGLALVAYEDYFAK